MSTRPRTTRIRNLGAATAAAIAALALSAAPAGAAVGYGELARFGSEGTGDGELSATACDPAEHQLELIEKCALDIGVDPAEENSVFVLDQPSEDEVITNATTKEEENVRHFEIQKFTKNGDGEYTATASVEFSATGPVNEELESEVEEPPVEGIAVDPGSGRIFVLVSLARPEDEEGEESLNYNDWAAAQLLSYSTATNGKGELTPEGKSAGSPVLVGESEFATFAHIKSTEAEQTLLDPLGITVDPYKHEVIVLGHVRKAKDPLEHEDETPPYKATSKGGHDYYILQRISETTGAFTEKYAESGTVFLDPTAPDVAPDSPVVAGTEHEPRVFVNFEGLVEIPYDFTSPERAKQIYRENHKYTSAFTSSRSPFAGGSMSALEGRIYIESELDPDYLNQNSSAYTGVYVRSGAGSNAGEGLAYTGGQSPTASPSDACVLEPGVNTNGTPVPLEAFVPVAAGSGQDVFALAPEYLATNSEHPAVVEFGPDGQGCPTASTKGVAAYAAGGSKVEEGEQIEPEAELTFKVPLSGADAREVEWKITEGGQTRTVTEKPKPVGGQIFETKGGLHEFEWKFEPETPPHPAEYVEPEYKAKVLTAGPEVTVEAAVKTDDAAEPELVTQSFALYARLPVAKIRSYKEFVVAHEEEDEFNAEGSEGASSKYPITEYDWNFGDGSEELKLPAKTGEKVKHKFEAPGTYTVRLTVKDAVGDAGEKTVQVIVKEDAAEEEARKQKEKQHQEEVEIEEHDLKLDLSSSRLTMRSGAVTVPLVCAGTADCNSGKITLVTASKVAVPHKRAKEKLTLGSGSFSLPPGGRGSVKVRLSKAAQAALKHDHSFKVKLTWVGFDTLASRHAGSYTITLAR
ncbi:MAG TPA: PKD domain-containing protein [Solirubrobacteraceae bacterium]|nr:PKD domain-containing protein [Solirubrobacteraceae bacterium]